ncbi:MAG: tRNA (N(6)-L-threonylcarbamoyladenosine(37)-C(2))-methylthiotransferase MtaB [Bacteroidales bacterium]|nr:tRNA (N(6)-L-threonylcarbamoyladenosine(37)-C(2))-methylthiotransferase MtaB [Bacteroidales bacterium]MDY0285018.1 tRNA (N(6)-L-threonylcarbamoyladenosine(37)-C(2))-methylthiotransferase MtaB [Bacteroidales bacterium]HPE86080.1 tRNA (N(6)-L-threonylcarbamoyladenosine(37)-C(2))-methylthiotransferase MtaB [Bacteroidales bacterium]
MQKTEEKKIAIKTFGCKLNYSESSQIIRELSEAGYKIVDVNAQADVYLIHSCTVTALAEKKTRQAIRHFKKLNPSAQIGVIGCYSQLHSEEILAMEEVDFIAGNETKYQLAKILQGQTIPEPNNTFREYGLYHGAYSLSDRTRSFLKVQDGCDYFCSYCAVAYARGRSRSDSISGVLTKANEAIEQGAKEIVLTGVNVGDFGKENNQTLFDLLYELEKLPVDYRLRLSSIEPNLLENRIIDLAATSKKIMPHFHIPLQSGNDEVLHRMKRRYSRTLFEEKVYYIKNLLPQACIAADVIVGFPGETDEEFASTFAFIQSLPLSCLHVFTYSDRPNTLSAAMKPKVAPKVKQSRSQILHKLSEQKQSAFYHENLHTTREVLFEEIRTDAIYGWSDNYIRVRVDKSLASHNELKNTILDTFEPREGVIIGKLSTP